MIRILGLSLCAVVAIIAVTGLYSTNFFDRSNLYQVAIVLAGFGVFLFVLKKRWI